MSRFHDLHTEMYQTQYNHLQLVKINVMPNKCIVLTSYCLSLCVLITNQHNNITNTNINLYVRRIVTI